MTPLAAAILITWNRNGAYAHRLVADLAPEQFLAQPVAGRVMNHPAWVLSHLSVYARISAQLLQRQPFPDPIDDPFGPNSQVWPHSAAYATPPQLVAHFLALHDAAEQALQSAPDAVFSEPNPVERWRAMHPSIGDMLVTLMVKHESGHLGQLSAWRRAMGLPRVAL